MSIMREIAAITKDNLKETYDKTESRVGTTWFVDSIQAAGYSYDTAMINLGKKTEFRLYDDDGVLYYEGWLYNDDECITQQVILMWGARDAGVTEIHVKLDNKWTQEIG